MVFRLLTTGLCAACVVLLATSVPVRVELPAPAVPPGPASRLRVVDIAAGVASSSIPRLVGLGRGEWVKAVNDHVPLDDVEAELLIGSLARPGGFLDLTVDPGDRRVLVLVH